MIRKLCTKCQKIIISCTKIDSYQPNTFEGIPILFFISWLIWNDHMLPKKKVSWMDCTNVPFQKLMFSTSLQLSILIQSNFEIVNWLIVNNLALINFVFTNARFCLFPNWAISKHLAIVNFLCFSKSLLTPALTVRIF